MSTRVDAKGDSRNDEKQPEPSTPREICPALYAALLQHPDKLLTQQDLLDMNVVPHANVELLSDCMNSLYAQRRVTSYTRDGQLLWKVVQPKDAARYRGLNQDETIVFSYIDTAQRDAIWTRHIAGRSRMTTQQVQKAVSSLTKRKLIKVVSNAKFPSRKMVMLAELEPSDDVTGGPFYTDGLLDEDFVYHMAECAYRFIASRSWDHGEAMRKGTKRSRTAAPGAEDAKVMPSEALQDINAMKSAEPWPLPPGYTGYPTVKDVAKALNASRLTDANMTESDASRLVDLLYWDGRVVKVMGGKALKSVKGIKESFELRANTNGLTEVPCGRCPVFEWCEEGGPVNPESCTYFDDWLAS